MTTLKLADLITRRTPKETARVAVYGPEGVGKTSFASNAPKPIFLLPEEGTGQLTVDAFPRITAYQQLPDSLNLLLKEDHDYKSVVIDTVDAFETLLFDEVCRLAGAKHIEDGKNGFGYGKGYIAAVDLWRGLLDLLAKLEAKKGMHVILLAHAHVKLFKNPDGADYDRWEMQINKLSAALIRQWCDDVLFAGYEILIDKAKDNDRKGKALGGARYIYTTHRPAFDAKNRHGLPDEMPLSWDAFAQGASVSNIDKRVADLRIDIANLLNQICDDGLSKKIEEKMPAATLQQLTDWKNRLIDRRNKDREKSAAEGTAAA
jgi:hypothetical protein